MENGLHEPSLALNYRERDPILAGLAAAVRDGEEGEELVLEARELR